VTALVYLCGIVVIMLHDDACVNYTERNTSEPRVPVYLPVFSAIIAISAFSAILWSFFRLRHSTSNVEEANFEFYHMTIQRLNYRWQEPVAMKMAAHKAKRFLGFWRARAYQKVKGVLWHSAPQCDESELQDVTERLLTTGVSYNTANGITAINS